MGHKTGFHCAMPWPLTLFKCCQLIHTLWLFNGSSKLTDPTVLLNGTDSFYDNRSSYHKGESWALTFPQTPEFRVVLIGKCAVSGQTSRGFLHFVFNRVIEVICFCYHFLHFIMAFQMLVIRKNIKEGRRVPLLDAWLLAGRGHCSVGLCVSRRMFYQSHLCSHYWYI